jgi:hypothetical protein
MARPETAIDPTLADGSIDVLVDRFTGSRTAKQESVLRETVKPSPISFVRYPETLCLSGHMAIGLRNMPSKQSPSL